MALTYGLEVKEAKEEDEIRYLTHWNNNLCIQRYTAPYFHSFKLIDAMSRRPVSVGIQWFILYLPLSGMLTTVVSVLGCRCCWFCPSSTRLSILYDTAKYSKWWHCLPTGELLEYGICSLWINLSIVQGSFLCVFHGLYGLLWNLIIKIYRVDIKNH